MLHSIVVIEQVQIINRIATNTVAITNYLLDSIS